MKTYSDNTLMSMTKKELIEIIRTLEYNLKNANDTLNVQYENYKKLLKEEHNKAIDDVISVIVDEIERETGCKLCSGYEEKGKCTTCQINKMIARVIDRLEQLKEVEQYADVAD